MPVEIGQILRALNDNVDPNFNPNSPMSDSSGHWKRYNPRAKFFEPNMAPHLTDEDIMGSLMRGASPRAKAISEANPGMPILGSANTAAPMSPYEAALMQQQAGTAKQGASDNWNRLMDRMNENTMKRDNSVGKYGLYDRPEDLAARTLAANKLDMNKTTNELIGRTYKNTNVTDPVASQEFTDRIGQAVQSLRDGTVNVDTLHDDLIKEHGLKGQLKALPVNPEGAIGAAGIPQATGGSLGGKDILKTEE